MSDVLADSRRDRCRRLLVLAGMAGVAVFTSGCAQPNHCASCVPSDVSSQGPNAMLLHTHRCVDPVPCEAVAAPPGTYVRQWNEAMGAQAVKQQSMITRNLWFDGSEQLGPDGQERVIAAAEALQHHPHLVLIEEEPIQIHTGQTYADALNAQIALNSARRANVVAALHQFGLPDADDWVVLTSDRSVGVRGIEAPMIFNRQYTSGGIGGGGIGRAGVGGGGIGRGGLGGGGIGGGGIF